jgi:hypothetical protein
VVNHQRG